MNKGYSKPLINLALLESLRYTSNADELDYYIPFLAVALDDYDKDVFAFNDLKSLIQDLFNITIPVPCLRLLLARAKKRKLIKLENKLYVKNSKALQRKRVQFDEKREEIVRAQKILTQEFIKFCKDKHNKNIAVDESDELIYSFVRKYQSTFVNVLKNRSETTPDLKIKNKDFIVADFVRNIFSNNLSLLDYFLVLIKGSLLADFLTYADAYSTRRNFSNVTIYYDTPIIMGLLGFNGRQNQAVFKELTALLNELKVNIRVFDITEDEVQTVFKSWQYDLAHNNPENFNPNTLRHFKTTGIDAVAIETASKKLPNELKKSNIHIESKQKIYEEHNIDEAGLEKHLRKGNYYHKNLAHDLKCIGYVYNSRKSVRRKTFNDEVDVFVTTNRTLVERTNHFLKEEVAAGSIPIIVTEQWLATVLWLKRPNLFPDLPKNLILANSYSVIYGDDQFWHEFIRRLKRLSKDQKISNDDYNLVRWEGSLIETIHNLSVSTGEDYQDEDIFQVIENVKAKLLGDKDKKILELEERFTMLEENSIIDRQIKEGQIRAHDIVALAFIRKVALVLATVTYLVFAGLLIYSYYNSIIFEEKRAAITLAVYGIVTTLFGISIFKLATKFSDWLTSKLYTLYEKAVLSKSGSTMN